MTDYEYKLSILCQRSHDENPDVFNKMFKDMVEKYAEAKKEGAREMVNQISKDKKYSSVGMRAAAIIYQLKRLDLVVIEKIIAEELDLLSPLLNSEK